MTDSRLAETLNEIERRELPLLSWGVSDGSYGEEEILALLREVQPSLDPEDLLDDLLADGLVVERGISGTRFRSRMAETVRLAVNLRQWFPGKPWRTAPALVSDMRFLSRPRVVPRRDITADELVVRLSTQSPPAWTPAHEVALRSILHNRDVSAFQARSTSRLLAQAASSVGTGTCISAGTGSGKTLSFYLPALTHLLSSPGPHAVPRIVGIYPRIELLRDQLKTLLTIVNGLHHEGVGDLRVGALYGASPTNRRNAVAGAQRGWERRSGGLKCPIVECLEEGCSGSYVWPDSAAEEELLICDSCGSELKSLSFSRDKMQSRPPDILFTTTETVNRLMGSGRLKKLIVGDDKESPEFLLLDEVHTYSGTHGAQVANLIRRWRSQMARPAHIVGLSATLADPIGFFSQLVGLDASSTSVVSPSDDEMMELGREYFMALRGDPASQASLLSTTIQTSMLLRRMLDAEPGRPSHGTFGTRLFVFTDKLDVVNRLHTQLQDAEGWLQGGVNRKPGGSLASLRESGGPDAQARDIAGQLWDASEALGTLHRPMKVSRTTSKDSGVESNTDVVVATASLEVGFDDPQVGAVLQHKAPRDAAQFLQRRGRAGRNPLMRPWTTVVLSDYGRDRLAFQAYEALFNPVVQPAYLPIHNRVILKMQATWWLLDTLCRFTSGVPVREVIASRWRTNPDRQRELAIRCRDGLRELITDSGIERLAAQLRWSLALEDEDVRSVLWDHPRALISAVIPTIMRRLEAIASISTLPEWFDWTDPLADFVPNSLFAPLQTPEIQIVLPIVDRHGEPVVEAEPVSQSMREFAPGRVSYRFALGGKRERMWVAPPNSQSEVLPLEEFCSDLLDLELPPGAPFRQLVQPRSLNLSRPDLNVADSSYGVWKWKTAFSHDGTPLDLDPPQAREWENQVIAVRAMTHRHRCPLTVWRYATECQVERRSKSDPAVTSHVVTLNGMPAGVGFSMDVDGLIVDCVLPAGVANLSETPGLTEALRVAYLEYQVQVSAVLTQDVGSTFLRDWLAQLLVSVVITKSGSGTVSELLDGLHGDRLKRAMMDAAREVFGALTIEDNDEGASPVDPGLVADIDLALTSEEVLTELSRLAQVLVAEPSAEWLPWIHERLLATLAAALIDAIQASCPDVDVEDLRPDVQRLQGADNEWFGRITVSEDQPGGTGVIESVVDRYVEDPRTFWTLVASALGPCDGERIDESLRQFLRAQSSDQFGGLVEQVRQASDLQSLTRFWSDLRQRMFELGLDADQTIVTALATRLLRPGSDRNVELLVERLLDRWDRLERSLELEVDLRAFAYTVSVEEEFRRHFVAVAGAESGRSDWLAGQVVGLLWTRGGRLRSASLQNYNPYYQLPPTERLLLSHVVNVPLSAVDVSDRSWRTLLDTDLRRDGAARLLCPDEESVSSAIREVLVQSTAVDVLELYPRVVGVKRSGTGFMLTVELREAVQ